MRKSPTKLRRAGRNRGIKEEVRASLWLRFVWRECARLQRRKPQETSTIAFANEAQFLLVSENSVDDLNVRLKAKRSSLQVDALRFRPNIVLCRSPSLPPYAEDNVVSLMIGNQVFNVRRTALGCRHPFVDRRVVTQALGQCGRCRMVGINQTTGKYDKEPLLTLVSYRRTSVRVRRDQSLRFLWLTLT